MTGALRSTARNPVAVGLMGILILVFLILGVGGGSRFPDLLAGTRGDAVAAAGAHAMSPRDFQKVFEQEQQRFEQQAGQSVPVDVLVKNGFDAQLLEAIAGDEAESEMLTRAGIRPPAEVVADEIKKLPFAFNRVTGKFDPAQYQRFLAEQGMTPAQAQSEIADEMAQRHFDAALQAGWRLPASYAALEALVALENRDITYFVLGPRAVPTPPPPTDAQLMAFMNEHAAQLRTPETRVISLVRFSAKALEPGVKVDPADVEKAFAERKDKLSSPERRGIVQIPVRTAAQAAEAQARLTRGEPPAAIAKAFGVEPVIYASAAQSDIADRRIAAAAFDLREGQVSGPIQGDLGAAVIKVTKVTPPAPATLESARPALETELRAKAARDQAFKTSEAYDEARQGGASMADAAKKAGATIITLGPITKDGLGGDGKPVAGLDPKIVKSAFSHAANEDSDLEDAGQGEYFALHVDRVNPPALPPLADKRALLAQAWTHEQLVTALKAKADAAVAQVHKGQSLEQAAAAAGVRVEKLAGLQRVKAQQYKQLGGEVLQAAFGSKVGDVVAAGAPDGIAVVRVDAARPADPQALAQATAAVRTRLTSDYLNDISAEVKDASRRLVRTSVNRPLACRSLGVDPSLCTPGAASAGGGSGAKAK